MFISHVSLHRAEYGEAGCLESCPHCHYNTGTKHQLDFHIKMCHKAKLHKQQVEAARKEESESTDNSDVEFISDDEVDVNSNCKNWSVDGKYVKEFGEHGCTSVLNNYFLSFPLPYTRP